MNIEHMTRPLAVKTLGCDGRFTGYASVFGELDFHNEIVCAGAFKKSLARMREKNQSPAMLWMHDPTTPVGVWVSLYEDENGLVVDGRLALATQKGREAYELMKMKALSGLSIGYRVVSSKIDKNRNARVLTEVELFEISLVTFPANDSARISDVKAPRQPDKRKRKADKKTASDDMTRAVVARLHRAAKTLKQKTARRK